MNPVASCLSRASLAAVVAGSLMYAPMAAADAANPEATLSVGAVKDQLDATVTRVIAKFADGWNEEDKLVVPAPNLKAKAGDKVNFYTLSRKLIVDATDKGTLGGLTLRYGVRLYRVGLKELPPDAPRRDDGSIGVKSDLDGWLHAFPIELGADTDRGMKNRDLLLEVGYVPVKLRRAESCFKLGANPIGGIAAQLGHRTRDPNAVPPAGEPAQTSGSLRRLKAELKLDVPMHCIANSSASADADRPADSSSPFGMVFSDMAKWTVMLTLTGWRDFVEDRSYHKVEALLRIPTGAKTFIDLKRELGAAPTTFDTGGKFSANLTIAF